LLNQSINSSDVADQFLWESISPVPNTVATLFSTVVEDNDALKTISSPSMHPEDEEN
jgi:hypothetical protein